MPLRPLAEKTSLNGPTSGLAVSWKNDTIWLLGFALSSTSTIAMTMIPTTIAVISDTTRASIHSPDRAPAATPAPRPAVPTRRLRMVAMSASYPPAPMRQLSSCEQRERRTQGPDRRLGAGVQHEDDLVGARGCERAQAGGDRLRRPLQRRR